MRLISSSPWPATLLAFAGLALGLTSCATFGNDPARDARLACDKKNGPSCFVAGNAVVEKNGPGPESIRLYIRGCSVRHSPSCDALANVKGPLRESALVGGCNAGDLVSCAKRANELQLDAGNVDEARSLRHSVCQKSATLSSGSPAREVEGIAESCASLAKMIAAGQGGGRDELAAAKLEVLAATLRNEALYRHEREDDAKNLPAPASAEPEPPRRKGAMKKAPKVDPGLADREKFRREYEARRAAREAWIASVQTGMIAAQRDASRGDPSMPALTALERATAMMPGGSGGPSQCQSCVESCGSSAKCSADDFSGGRCGHLRCKAGEPCPAFDTCVGECTTRTDTCVKACGDCTVVAPAAEPAKGAKP